MEKRGRVDDLLDQGGAEQCSDVRPSAPEQAGTPQHDRGDAAERVRDSLRRITDPDLGHEHYPAQEREA